MIFSVNLGESGADVGQWAADVKSTASTRKLARPVDSVTLLCGFHAPVFASASQRWAMFSSFLRARRKAISSVPPNETETLAGETFSWAIWDVYGIRSTAPIDLSVV